MPTLWGPLSQESEEDDDGYRTYTVDWLIQSLLSEGPAAVMQTPGLPQPGAMWLLNDDIDVWVWCRPNKKVKYHEHKRGDPHEWWVLTQTFSNKPQSGEQCKDQSIEDPLLQPQERSGGSAHYTEQVSEDRFGNTIENSAHELFQGPQVEFDAHRSQVKISQNVAILDEEFVDSMVDTVNDDVLWNRPPRSVKLSNWTWDRKLWGLCFRYFVRKFEFEIHPKGWDRDLRDEGTKVLNGHWLLPQQLTSGSGSGTTPTGFSPITWALDQIWDGTNFVAPDPEDPSHFIRYQDRNGNPARVVLNGAGCPATVRTRSGTGTGTSGHDPGDPGEIHVEYYDESNFLLLGIPTDLES